MKFYLLIALATVVGYFFGHLTGYLSGRGVQGTRQPIQVNKPRIDSTAPHPPPRKSKGPETCEGACCCTCGDCAEGRFPTARIKP